MGLRYTVGQVGGVLGHECRTFSDQLIPTDDFWVLKTIETIHIHHNHQLKAGNVVLNFQVLVQLLIIFNKEDLNLGISDNVFALRWRIGLIYARDDGAKTMACHVGINPFLPVFRKNAQTRTIFDTSRRKCTGYLSDRGMVIVPAVALPNAEVLFHVGRFVT